MDQERWNAIKQSDPTADGTFYYGVKTTGIFCLPSCKSKTPREENVVLFDSFEQAIHSEFRPCKRCRPDLYPHYAPNEEILLAIKDFLEKSSDRPPCLDDLAQHFSMSSFHLVRIFKKRFGLTPREFVRANQLSSAKTLLISSDLRTMDIALQCGFSSYTTFFTNFKQATGLAPEEYRQGGNV